MLKLVKWPHVLLLHDQRLMNVDRIFIDLWSWQITEITQAIQMSFYKRCSSFRFYCWLVFAFLQAE